MSSDNSSSAAVRVFTILFFILFAVFTVSASYLTGLCLAKGLLAGLSLRYLLIVLFLVIGGLCLVLGLTRRIPALLFASVILLLLSAASLLGISVIKSADSAIENVQGDASRVTTTVDIITADTWTGTTAADLGGRTAGYTGDFSEAQLSAVMEAIDLDAENVNYVYTGTSSESVAALLSGGIDYLLIPQNIYEIRQENFPDETAGLKVFATVTITVDASEVGNTIADSAQSTLAAAVTPTPTPEPTATPVPGASTYLIYISGNDNFGSITEDTRSDVNIIAAVNMETHKVQLISTPRDYFIPISVSGTGCRDKLTHTGIYGIQCSIDTLANFYGISFDRYVKVNFSGFVEIIDAIGGIDIDNDISFTDDTGYYFPEGNIHLDGTLALAYARDRHNVGIAERGKHHMMIIEAVINKVISSPEILADYSSILASLSDAFTTDFTSEDFYSIVSRQLADNRGWTFDIYQTSGEGDASTQTYSLWGDSVYVVWPDMDTVAEAQRLIAECLAGN